MGGSTSREVKDSDAPELSERSKAAKCGAFVAELIIEEEVTGGEACLTIRARKRAVFAARYSRFGALSADAARASIALVGGYRLGYSRGVATNASSCWSSPLGASVLGRSPSRVAA